MFGFDDYLYRLAGEPELVHAFSQRVLNYQKKFSTFIMACWGAISIALHPAMTLAHRTAPFMSGGMFDEFIKPYLKERISHTKKHTDTFTNIIPAARCVLLFRR